MDDMKELSGLDNPNSPAQLKDWLAARLGHDVKSIDKLYVLDLEISADAAINNYLNSRVYVRFEHPAEPLAWQWYRGIRRMFLKKFNV